MSVTLKPDFLQYGSQQVGLYWGPKDVLSEDVHAGFPDFGNTSILRVDAVLEEG
jgi:hypothetical protein